MKLETVFKTSRKILASMVLTVLFCLPYKANATSVPIMFGGNIVGQEDATSYWHLKTQGIVMQKMDYSCGSASLATILTYYLDNPTTETDIIQYLLSHGDLQAIIKRQGFSLLDLKNYAEHEGFVAQGFRMEISDLLKVHDPVLVPIVIQGYRHFVVYIGNKDGRVFLLDPTFGAVSMTISEFKKIWCAYENVGLIITKNGYNENENKILTIAQVREIYVRNSLVQNIINQIAPFLIKNPSSW
jgi:predicted double-glycine peptidase